ncbi:MAG: 50S ribosomal protein L6, partial [Planctomycetota bacterium]
MSRIGNKPVEILRGVDVNIAGNVVTVKGTKGELSLTMRPEVSAQVDDGKVLVARCDDAKPSKAFHGLTRSLIANMIEGVAKGYEKKLEVVGVGYIASLSGDTLQLRVGYANELHKKVPAGLTVTCPDQTHIVVQGCDKQLVSQFAAEVRALRKPEPYKGKGIRYQGEQVKL